MSLSDEEKLEVVHKAVKATSQLSKNPTHSGLSGDCGETQLAVQLPIESEIQQGTSMSTSSTRGASGSDVPISSVPVSMKMKLVLNHTLQPDQPDSRVRDEINNYLRYVPGDDEDNPLVFWKKGLFPSLEATAKNCLTRSASSVPVENLFSTMGLLLNGKRMALAPHRANWLSLIIHDNFEMYNNIDM